MLRTALLAAALAVVPASRAQTSTDLWPLVPGNTWTFVTRSRTSSPAGGSETTLTGAFDWMAVDSVDTPAGRLPGLRRGTEAGPAECAVRKTVYPSGETLIELRDPAADTWCDTISLPVAEGDGPIFFEPEMQPVVVGGEALGEHPVTEAFSDWSGPGGIGGFYTHRFAVGIGPLSHSYADRRGNSFGRGLRRTTLGGVDFGQPLGSRADFWPLEAGNRWEFRLTDASGAYAGAVAWTAVADGAGLALRLDRYADGAIVSTVTCPISVGLPTAETSWQTGFGLACTLPDPLLFPSRRPGAETVRVDIYTEAVDVTIGATTVVADVAESRHAGGGGSQNPFREARAGLARGIGPWWYSIQHPESAPPGTYRRGDLGYARVGGTEYGAHVVAADGPPEATTLALAVAPNPVAGTAHVRFSLDAPAEALRLVVLDALGRRVAERDLGARAAGDGEAALDVSRLAPGVYTVRLLGAGSGATARLSVVR